MKSALAAMMLVLAVVTTSTISASDESAAVAATVEAFHSALAHGDAKSAMSLLAPDAVILESGFTETRAEYERTHLAEDIKFAQAVHGNRSDVQVGIDGKAAWLTSRSHAEGSFEGKPVNSVGVELVILTRNSTGWLIRAIHWSSHKVTKAE